MLTSHYTHNPQKSNFQQSPFPLAENLAEGRTAGLEAIQHAGLFTGRIHICRLRSMSGGDPTILDELIAEADKRGIQVMDE
jgi:hypothetical protein